MPRRFECKEDNAYKFWEIEQSGNCVTTWWGRIGTSGQSKSKDFASESEAKLEYGKLVAEKTRKGYAEIGAPEVAAGVVLAAKKVANVITEDFAPTVSTPSQQELTTLLTNLEEEVKKHIERQGKNKFFSFAPEVNLSDYPSTAQIFKLSPAGQAAIVAAILIELKSKPRMFEIIQVFEAVATKLCKHKLPFDRAQLITLINFAADDFQSKTFSGNTVLGKVDEFLSSNSFEGNLESALISYKYAISKGNYTYSDGPDTAGQKLMLRIDLLIAQSKGRDLPIPISPDEAWSDQAIFDLEAFDQELRQHWLNLIEHCGRISGTTPSGTWTKRANQLVSAVGEEDFIVHLHKWFSLIPKKGTRIGEVPNGFGVNAADVFHPQNVEIMKGLAYCCVGRTDGRLASALGDAAEASFKKVTGHGPRCPKLGTACVHSLSSMNTKESVAQLTRVQARAKHASVRVQIEKALNNAATKSGMTVDDLQDLGVPDFGMQEVGKLVLCFGEWSAQLTIEDSDSTAVSWISSSGKIQPGVPAAIKTSSPDAVKELKKIEKDLEKLLPGLRHRIERSYIDQRHWRFDQWRERYLDHPVIGTMARRLLWNFNGRAGAWLDGKFVDQAGASFMPEDMALVELWHPIGSEPNDVLHWRRWLTQNRVVQPFKQCHREIYVLTDAEIQTRTYSNRFASHVLRQHQFQHLCSQRGWQYQLMGSFDFQSTPTLELPRWDLKAEFYVDIPGNSDEAGIYTTIGSDQVRFLRSIKNQDPNHSDGFAPVELREIMPILFSEVMRDVDLFIGVSSIGTDPNWTQGHRTYWQEFSFGELSSTAETRKQVLKDIIPLLSISSRCTFDSKFLIVRGDIRTYKIHFGSGNILMEPNDQYLCIVAGRGMSQPHRQVFLPFEGDAMLSMILSKAVLLADDTKIKDTSIVHQIKNSP